MSLALILVQPVWSCVKQPNPRRPMKGNSMEELECDGACEVDGDCEGDVKTYHVQYSVSLRDWGRYNYCDIAAEKDRENGFTLTEIK